MNDRAHDISAASLSLRGAVPHDVPAIADICARAATEAYADLVTPDYLARVIAHFFNETRLASEIAPGPHWFGFVVAVNDRGRVLGVAGTGRTACVEACELFTIYVAPEAQGRGVGRTLVADAAATARAAGATWIDAAVLPGNVGADRFYRACGFAAVGTRPIYAPHGPDGGPAVAQVYRADVSAPGRAERR